MIDLLLGSPSRFCRICCRLMLRRWRKINTAHIAFSHDRHKPRTQSPGKTLLTNRRNGDWGA